MPAPPLLAHTCETTVNICTKKISDIQNSALPYLLLESMEQEVDQLDGTNTMIITHKLLGSYFPR